MSFGDIRHFTRLVYRFVQKVFAFIDNKLLGSNMTSYYVFQEEFGTL